MIHHTKRNSSPKKNLTNIVITFHLQNKITRCNLATLATKNSIWIHFQKTKWITLIMQTTIIPKNSWKVIPDLALCCLQILVMLKGKLIWPAGTLPPFYGRLIWIPQTIWLSPSRLLFSKHGVNYRGKTLRTKMLYHIFMKLVCFCRYIYLFHGTFEAVVIGFLHATCTIPVHNKYLLHDTGDILVDTTLVYNNKHNLFAREWEYNKLTLLI